jgi:hypothetical protein
MANYRRLTKGLDRNAVVDLNDAWHHARKIGRPLNMLVTLRPLDIDDIASEDRTLVWRRLLNKLGAYARYRGFGPFTAAWARESNPDGSGEHLHVLMHVPLKHREHFELTVYGWYHGASEIDVRVRHQVTSFTADGRRKNAIGYITKQMTPQASYRRGVIRRRGGLSSASGRVAPRISASRHGHCGKQRTGRPCPHQLTTSLPQPGAR